jgi:putative ABC transport system permease protein
MSVWQDIRLALRLLRRTPGLTGIALLSIALSVGATAVVFTAIKSVLIDPLPYARAGELVQIGTDFAHFAQSHGDWVYWHDTQEIIRRTRTLASVGIYGNAVFDLAGDAVTPPEALYGLRMSPSPFPTLGVSPMLGRSILPGEDQPHQTNEMILSYGLWQRRFQADPGVIGRTITVNGRDCVVIGVMPAGFNFPLRREAAHTPAPYVEFWAPLRIDPAGTQGGLGAVARLRPGITLAEARQDLASISAALSREFPGMNRDASLRLAPLRDRIVRSSGDALWLLMAAALLFLLIGCANVANLLLARGVFRRREIAVRMAIGAGGPRIIRQLLTESCVLGALGGLGGYALTVAAWKILPAIAPVSIPRLAGARADWRVLAFALIAALANSILFGIAPALRAAGRRQAVAIPGLSARGGAAGKHDRIRGLLVIGEVAVTVMLVVVGGELLGSFISLLGTDPGFQADRVLASVVLPANERYPTPEQRAAVYRRFLDSVRSIPGVESAGTVDALPFSGENHGGSVSTSEAATAEPNSQAAAEIDVIGGEYLQALGVRLRDGRWFREEEMKESSDAALVNEVLARRLWPNTSAIGKAICVYCTPEDPRHWKRVVGVVSNVRHAALEGPAGASVYLSAGALESAAFLVVNTERPSGEMENAIRRAIAAVDPNQPVLLSTSMRTLIADSVADRRFILTLLSVTGCLAILMAAAGIYGVTWYATSRRTQEIGVRMALGATPGNVHALVFRQGFLNVAVGLVSGLGASVILLRTLRGVLVGLDTGNPSNLALAVGVVAVTGALSCWLPARRATKIDPISALRED